MKKILTSFLLGVMVLAPSKSEAIPLFCLETQATPFLNALAPRQEGSFAALLRRAEAALDQGASESGVSREEAQNLAEAALVCGGRLSSLSPPPANPEKAARALNYMAALALYRQMTDPLNDAAGVQGAARRLIGTTEPKTLSDLAAYPRAAQRLMELRNAARRLASPRAAQPLRGRVDALLSERVALGGSSAMEGYLNHIKEPVRERQDLLLAIALTRASARSLIGKIISYPIDGAGAEDVQRLGDQEVELLEDMREQYARFFPSSGNEPFLVETNATPERLTKMRETLEARGLERETLREFCVVQGEQEGCVSGGEGMFKPEGPYPDDPRLQALAPLRLLDEELRRSAALLAAAFIPRFNGLPNNGTPEDLEQVERRLGNVAAPSENMPKTLSEYQEGDLKPEIFQLADLATRTNFCAPPPSQKTEAEPAFYVGFAPGDDEVVAARATIEAFAAKAFPEAFPVDGSAEGDSLATFCAALQAMADSAKETPQ